MLILLTISMLNLTVNIQPAKSEWTETVYIRADGSIDPPDAPIQRYGNIYTLTGNITGPDDGIIVERDNIIVEGAGYVFHGGLGSGIDLSYANNVTIKNMKIKAFSSSISLHTLQAITCQAMT